MDFLRGGLLGLFWLTVSVAGFAQYQKPPDFMCPEFGVYPCNCTAESDEGIAVECDNTNLASMAVGLRAAAEVQIANLTITNCNMERLYGDVFRSNNIVKLVVRDTPIRDIANDTFVGVGQHLQEFQLINSRLKTFPRGALQALAAVKKIVIDKSDLEELPGDAFLGLSTLKEIQVSNARVSTLAKNVFNGQRNLKKLSLHNNNITDIVRGTYDFGHSVEHLDLAHNHLGRTNPQFFGKLTKLIVLNLTDNGIKKFSGRDFGRNQLLTVLNLSQNNITSLDSPSFRGMRYLRRLYFDFNQISQIGRRTFQSLKRIGGIYLRGNLLTKLDFEMFAGLRFADTIDVSRNQIGEVQKNVFKELYLATINMSYNHIERIPAGTFIQCDNLTLDISHNNIQDIDPDAFDELSYAFHFDASYNQLTNFSQIPMKFQKGIKLLNVSFNQIQTIPKNSFPKLYELGMIDFSHNNITTIGRSVFSKLFSIRHLNFSHNHLAKIESFTFGKIPTLLDVDLSHNLITQVKRGAFGNLVSIRSIYLDHNMLEEIPRPPISLNHLHMSHNNVNVIKGRQPWPTMNSLISLHLDFNSLGDNLSGGRLAGLNTLQELHLRGNGMTSPPREALGSLQSLRLLSLDHNNFTRLERKSFGRLPVVFNLTLAHNQINNISMNAFEGLLQLIHVDLSHNNLSFVPPGAFASLVALRNIDLSHNSLEKLENKTHGLFDDCLSIRRLDLSFNRIPFVTKKMFPESKWIPYKLEEVDLSHNRMPVLTDGILRGTRHLKRLNVSHNIINDVRKYVLGNLTSLESLDMSHNNLANDKLRAERWGGEYDGVLPNLTHLSLAHNQLYALPAALLASFPALATLDITGNQLIHYYPVFTPNIKAGLDLRYGDNNLRCECSLRPVINWLRAGGRVTSWDQVYCHSPGYLSGKAVSQVREEQLVCDSKEEALDYRISPDVQFRDVKQDDTSVSLSWYVNTNEDVADFRVELTKVGGGKPGARPRTLLVKDISYNTRYDVIDHVPGSGGEQLRMCLLTKTSLGNIRRWRQDQCQPVGPFSGGPGAAAVSVVVLAACLLLSLYT